jgi:histidine ammonia-lyase
VGEEPLVLGAKEGLALINGTEIMKAVGVAVLLRAENISRAADAVASLTVEALQGSVRPFDERLAELKGADNNEELDSRSGHRRTAANLRACLADSEIITSHLDCDRVQDPYSLRCVPQVHGAFKTALSHVRCILAGEINAVTDNPLLFPETDEVISAGQFHGQPISMVMDYLGLALCTLANISERRVEQLVNPDLSGLPPFLTRDAGLNSGMMIAQVAAAALASENKILAHPASVDTIPTSACQEDHVSMGTIAARKARSILDNVEHVLAIEWLCATQGLELRTDLAPGGGAEAIRQRLREDVRPLRKDRYLHNDMRKARELLRNGELVCAAEAAVGPLAP